MIELKGKGIREKGKLGEAQKSKEKTERVEMPRRQPEERANDKVRKNLLKRGELRTLV